MAAIWLNAKMKLEVREYMTKPRDGSPGETAYKLVNPATGKFLSNLPGSANLADGFIGPDGSDVRANFTLSERAKVPTYRATLHNVSGFTVSLSWASATVKRDGEDVKVWTPSATVSLPTGEGRGKTATIVEEEDYGF